MTAKRAPTQGMRPPRRLPVVWSQRALSDLQDIGDYIAQANPSAAARWVLRLISAAEELGLAPLAGRMVPELARRELRETLLRTYRVVYRVTSHRLEILTVFESHRRFPDDL